MKTKFLIPIAVIFALLFQSFLDTPPPTINSLPCVGKTFQIAVHIVKDSLGEPNIEENDILVKVDEMNELFDSICVKFEICEFNYIDDFQYDTLGDRYDEEYEEMLTKYRKYGRINLFFVDELEHDDALDCGLTTKFGLQYPDSGGIVIKKSGECFTPDSKELPYQMGIFFGLNNTAGAGGELVDASNCAVTGDSLCDTPADPFDSRGSASGAVNNCKFTNTQKDGNDTYYNPIIGNIMSEYPQECKCEYSREQYLKMVDAINNLNKLW